MNVVTLGLVFLWIASHIDRKCRTLYHRPKFSVYELLEKYKTDAMGIKPVLATEEVLQPSSQRSTLKDQQDPYLTYAKSLATKA